MTIKLVVFYGSVRSARQGIKAARFVVNACRARGHETFFADPLELALPLLDKRYREYAPGEAPQAMETLAQHIRAADAFIVVTGEYNHGIPPALSNMLDHFLEDYARKPSAIVSYSAGSFAGVRAAMSLRATLAVLGMASIPPTMPVPEVHRAFEDDGTPNDEAYHRRIGRLLDELEWYAHALKAARERDAAAD